MRTTTFLSLVLVVASTTGAHSTLLDLPFHKQGHADQVAAWRAHAAAYKAAQSPSAPTTPHAMPSPSAQSPHGDDPDVAAWRQHAASYKAEHFPAPSSVSEARKDDDGVAAWRAHAQSYAKAQGSVDPDASAWRAHASSVQVAQALPIANVEEKDEKSDGQPSATTPQDFEDKPEIVNVSKSEQELDPGKKAWRAHAAEHSAKAAAASWRAAAAQASKTADATTVPAPTSSA